MKRIFILGGSRLQLDLIFEAKKFYFEVYLFDGNYNCEGKKYADIFYHIDIKDKELILEKAKELKPLVVTTIASEIGNLTACYVSEKLNLISNSYQIALNTTNKKLMKDISIINSLNIPKFKVINSFECLSDWNNFPSVIKPIDSSAGRGISFISNKNQIKEAIEKAFSFTNKKEILIEEYIEGRQFSIETISFRGIHLIVAITEEYLTPIPEIIETQQLIPARIIDEERNLINEFVLRILNSYQIKFGACHIEIKIDNQKKLYLIEIASRMGGWRSELINLSLGINYCQLLLFSLLGKEIDFQASRDDTAIVKMILSEEDFKEYTMYYNKYFDNLVSLLNVKDIKKSKHLADSNGFYFIHIQNKDDISKFIEEHH